MTDHQWINALKNKKSLVFIEKGYCQTKVAELVRPID